MPGFRLSLRTLVKSDSGVTALEYGLIAALIGVAAIGAMSGVGKKLDRNLEIIIVAVSDPRAPVDNPGRDNPTDPDPRSEPARTPVPDIPAPAPGDDIERNFTTTNEDEQPDRSSDGENLDTGAGGSDPSYTAAVSTADGSGVGSTRHSGAGGAGRSAGSGGGNAAVGSNGAADPGAGQVGEPGDGEPGGKSLLFGRDSTSAASHDDMASWPGNTLPKQFGASGSGGKTRSIDPAPGGSGESPLKSAIILLLWLCLGIGVIILGWKISLRTAAKKDAEEQLENWESASFSEKSVAQLG